MQTANRRSIKGKRWGVQTKLLVGAVCLSSGSLKALGQGVALYTWGNNGSGQLGDGSTDQRNIPYEVSTPLNSQGPIYAGAGKNTGYAVIDGSLYAWGYNGDGEFGNGSYASSNTAVETVSGGVTAVSGGTPFASIIQNGYINGFGNNDAYQLGNGTNTSSAVPVAASSHVEDSAPWVSISCGLYHELAVTSTGYVGSWGDNTFGESGIGSTPYVFSYGIADATSAAAGLFHSLAVFGGSVYAWGYNASGEAGNGSFSTQASGTIPANLSTGVSSVGAGSYFSFATRAGSLWAWGLNSSGQLGDGTTSNLANPELVQGISNIVSATGSTGTSYALSSNGILWAWGDNSTGELGTGDYSQHLTPAQVTPPPGCKWASVMANPDSLFVEATAARDMRWTQPSGDFFSAGWQQYGTSGFTTTTSTDFLTLQSGSVDCEANLPISCQQGGAGESLIITGGTFNMATGSAAGTGASLSIDAGSSLTMSGSGAMYLGGILSVGQGPTPSGFGSAFISGNATIQAAASPRGIGGANIAGIIVGGNINGQVVQSQAASISVPYVQVGTVSGAGFYFLQGGTLACGYITVGSAGNGAGAGNYFEQTGGNLTISDFVQSGGISNFSAGVSTIATLSISGGTSDLSSGAVTITNAIVMTGGTLNVNAPPATSIFIPSINQSGGSVNLDCGTVALNSGSMNGGTLRCNGANVTTSGFSCSGTAVVDVQSGTISSGSLTLYNGGLLNWSGGSWSQPASTTLNVQTGGRANLYQGQGLGPSISVAGGATVVGITRSNLGINTIYGFNASGIGWPSWGGPLPTFSNDILTLTNGSANQTETVSTRLGVLSNSFTVSFTYSPSGMRAGDGMVFQISDLAGEVGEGGTGLGYGGTEGESAGVAFNLSAAQGVGTAYVEDGTLPSSYTSVAPVVLNSGNPIDVILSCQGLLLTETLKEENTAHTWSATYYANVLSYLVSRRYQTNVGFTASTDNNTAIQQISKFRFYEGALGQQYGGDTLVTKSLSLAGSIGAWNGIFDIRNNDVDLQSGDLTTLTNQVAQAYDGGTWMGANGITSSVAALDPTHLTAVGVIQNNQSGTALYTASNPFEGVVPGAGDFLLKYTYYGDANLDGKVDGSDYSLIDNGYLRNLTGWFNGDFNYDGVVDGSDYTLIDNAFNQQGAQLSTEVADITAQIAGAGPSPAVPEPTSLAFVLIVAGALGRRRPR